jgi:hypothetical protein
MTSVTIRLCLTQSRKERKERTRRVAVTIK